MTHLIDALNGLGGSLAVALPAAAEAEPDIDANLAASALGE